LAAAAASRSDQPIAFGSAVIDSGLSSRRLPELPQVARKLHELSQLVLQLLSQPVLHKVSHEESHPSLHEESQSSSQTNWNGFEMITVAVYSRVILWEQSAEHCRSRLGLTRWLTRRTHSHTPGTSRLKETCLPAPPALPWRRHRRQIQRQVPRHRSRHREPTPPRRGRRAARHPAPPREAGPKVSPKVHTKAPPRQAPPRRRAAVRTRPVHG
jgi:hypothetical protein